MTAALRWLVPALLLAGCSPAGAAAWVPTVSVRATVVQSRDRRAAASQRRWGWRVGVDTRWRFARPEPAPDDPGPIDASPPRSRIACVDARLCAWEQRARRRAMRRLHEGRTR